MGELSRVMIAGGGLGGLCLAQGLTKAGVEVAVYERDAQSTSRLQGYRISLTPDGLASLRATLPDHLWTQVVAACTPPLPGISFLSERLEPRFFKATPPPEDDVHRYSSISRVTLREILLQSLGDRVHFGRACTGFDVATAGGVRCRFATGQDEEGSLLVGADGVNSAIRSALMAVDNRYDTGVSAIAGKVALEGLDAGAILASPVGGSAVIIGDAPQGLFIADHQLTAFQGGERYVFWSFLTRRERLPEHIEEAVPERLRAIVDVMTPAWHPRLKHLIHSADPTSVMLLHYASSRPPQAWIPCPVTLIGDAVHNMPPTGGEGANMALRDARTLCEKLISEEHVQDALSAYQDEMRAYAFKAVSTSMANLDRMTKRS